MTFIEIFPYYAKGVEIYRDSNPKIGYRYEADLSYESSMDDFIRFYSDAERKFCHRIDYNTGFSAATGLFADDWQIDQSKK